jgi:ribosomal protein S17
MSALWNLLSPLRTGHIPLAHSGRELFGTVIKHGINLKTVTVKVDRYFYHGKSKTVIKRSGKF